MNKEKILKHIVFAIFILFLCILPIFGLSCNKENKDINIWEKNYRLSSPDFKHEDLIPEGFIDNPISPSFVISSEEMPKYKFLSLLMYSYSDWANPVDIHWEKRNIKIDGIVKDNTIEFKSDDLLFLDGPGNYQAMSNSDYKYRFVFILHQDVQLTGGLDQLLNQIVPNNVSQKVEYQKSFIKWFKKQDDDLVMVIWGKFKK